MSSIMQKYFSGLTKAGQKIFLSGLGKITNRNLAAIRKVIAAGGKAAQIDELIAKYGYAIVFSAFVSSTTTEVVPNN
ncbi:MAG: hypothetical protein VB118_11630 [Oscillospiraceae bacterium]|nr:hypothetical protein [Oscillospiraceae bacterium]